MEKLTIIGQKPLSEPRQVDVLSQDSFQSKYWGALRFSKDWQVICRQPYKFLSWRSWTDNAEVWAFGIRHHSTSFNIKEANLRSDVMRFVQRLCDAKLSLTDTIDFRWSLIPFEILPNLFWPGLCSESLFTVEVAGSSLYSSRNTQLSSSDNFNWFWS